VRAHSLCDLITGTMIEVVIERWKNAQGETDFRWSVWSDGDRIEMGSNAHSNGDDCEGKLLGFAGAYSTKSPTRLQNSNTAPAFLFQPQVLTSPSTNAGG